MAINLGSAYGKVSLDVNGLINAVRTGKANLKELGAYGQQLGSSLKSVGQAMTLGLTLPILATGAAAIKAASDYEETKNKAIVVFGEMADSIVANSDRAAATLGVSKQQYLDYASSIGAALTAGGMGIEESTALAEQAVKHFADLASFHNAEVSDVAMAWQSAIRGQYEPIQRYFPFITDSYLKTYGIANGLVDANTKNLTANQRAIILNAIALNGQLNPALNDFAETSDGLANSTRIMQAELKDALVMLGTNLLPIALEIVQGLNALLMAFNNVPAPVQKAIIVLAGLVAVLGPILSFLGTIISLISGIAGMATSLSGLGISFAGVAAAAGSAGSVLLSFGAAALSALGSILLLLAGPALLYAAFATNFGGIRTTTEQLWFIIKYYFTQGWQWLINSVRNGAQALGNGFRSMVQRIRDAFTNLRWSDIGKYIVMGIINGFLGGIPLLAAAAVKAAQTVLSTLKRTLDSRSPSRKTMVEGLNAAKGFMGGIEQGMDARQLTRTFARPIEAAGQSTNQTISMNFANGVTIRQVQQMLALNNEQLLRKLNTALGGS